MRRIKVLHISPDGELFGTERHILSIVKNSNKNNFEHWVAIPREGTFSDELRKCGINYAICGRFPAKKFPWQGFLKNNGLLRLLKLIRREHFDIVHTHLNTYGGFAAKFAGCRNVVHTRHGIFWTEEELKEISFLKKIQQRFKSYFFSKTIALSEIEKSVMVDYFNYNEKKISVIYNGVTINKIESKLTIDHPKAKLFNTNKFLAGGVGRFERQKGFHLFIEAAAKTTSKISDIQFVIIGRGSLREKLEEQIKAMNLSGKVILMDYQKNIFDYMNAFDVMLSSSLWEGVPYVILEAMALGKPTIAFTSKLSGVSEMIEDGKDGFLIPHDYVNNMVERIEYLYANKDKLTELSNASRRRISNQFSEEKMIAQTEKIYSDILLSKN